MPRQATAVGTTAAVARAAAAEEEEEEGEEGAMQAEEEAMAPRTSATGTTRRGRSGARSTLAVRGRASLRGASASTASGVAASADPDPGARGGTATRRAAGGWNQRSWCLVHGCVFEASQEVA